MKYHIITYGCQMNKSDSERIAAVLESAGFLPASEINKTDLLIINSCSVRQSAINRIFGLINNLKKQNKKKSKRLKTVLTGCVLPSDKKKLADKFSLVFDIKELPKLAEKLKKVGIIGKTKKTESPKKQGFKAFNYSDYFKINPRYRSKFSAYVPIMTGCDNFCSYCAVPHTRGREISRPAGEIVKEIEKLVKKGYKEITLLGQNVNSYKSEIQNPPQSPFAKEYYPCSPFAKGVRGISASDETKTAIQINFPKLLKLISGIPGDFWIRFLTSHPKDMSDELIETMAKCEKVCEYVHLPMQSGDDEILKKMNRKYTAEHFLKLVEMIRRYIPKAAISTDIIVGFPGETKKRFANTAKIMKTVKYDMAYLSQYSPRPGTAAAKLKDNIPIAEKKRRKEYLNEILKKTALANNKKYVGKIVEVLVEKTDDNFAYGKTRTFKNAKVQNPPQSFLAKGEEKCAKKIPPFGKGRLGGIFLQPGQFAKVKITKATVWGLEGKIAE